MSIPSWCRKGAKVQCIESFEHSRGYRWEKLPALGGVYTIRSVSVVPGEGVFLRFKELRNRFWFYSDSPGECRFNANKFRPLVARENDAEIEAQIYHKKGLHQSTPRRKAVEA